MAVKFTKNQGPLVAEPGSAGRADHHHASAASPARPAIVSTTEPGRDHASRAAAAPATASTTPTSTAVHRPHRRATGPAIVAVAGKPAANAVPTWTPSRPSAVATMAGDTSSGARATQHAATASTNTSPPPESGTSVQTTAATSARTT